MTTLNKILAVVAAVVAAFIGGTRVPSPKAPAPPLPVVGEFAYAYNDTAQWYFVLADPADSTTLVTTKNYTYDGTPRTLAIWDTEVLALVPMPHYRRDFWSPRDTLNVERWLTSRMLFADGLAPGDTLCYSIWSLPDSLMGHGHITPDADTEPCDCDRIVPGWRP
jgi:hypothetical protein